MSQKRPVPSVQARHGGARVDGGRLWMERTWIALRGNHHNVALFHVGSVASLGSWLDSRHA